MNAELFPSNAFALATSAWYFDPSDHRSPHDSWLESVVVSEPAIGARSETRSTILTIKLLGAYHDGNIWLKYSNVKRYALAAHAVSGGHGDWRFDEFRVTEKGLLEHAIEWSGPSPGIAEWVIVAEDVEFSWVPLG
jgi:hypothetical protein